MNLSNMALALVVALGLTASASAAGCAVDAASLAPPGGLPSDWVGTLSPRLLFFQALADFSYEKDVGSGTKRTSVGPCLSSWGVKEWERVSATSEAGADVHALVMRTDSDIIVSFRGMDSTRDLRYMDTRTAPRYDADFYGAKAVAAAAATNAAVPKALAGGEPNPEAFWMLDGYTEGYKAIAGPVAAVVAKWAPKMSGNTQAQSSTYRLWFTGHSDGSQLAQLAAIKHASEHGADVVGGVVMFGPSRVGSKGFAVFYNSLLGEKTVYYSYGRDPAANTDYTIPEGLFFPGTGIYACPTDGKPTESLVIVPLMGDRMNVCSDIKPVDTPLSRLWLPDFLLDTSDPMVDHLSNWEYLSHHIPSVTYDGLLRMLQAGLGASKPDACAMKAITLPQCVISHKCSAALRPADATRCRGCATDETCTSYWGMPNGRCDRHYPLISGWLCYDKMPSTQAGLYFDKNGAPTSTEFATPRLGNSFMALAQSSNPSAHSVGK